LLDRTRSQRNIGSLTRERECNRRTDATPGAGDDRTLAFQ
jgi:hypothetical protein